MTVPPGTRPRTVIFDLGGVLIDWNPRYHFRDVFKGDEAAMERFLGTVCTSEWNQRQDAGRTIAEAEAELIGRHPDQAALIRGYYGGFDRMMKGAVAGTVAILEELHATGVPLYALTNWSAETFPIGRRRFEFLERFRGIVVSGEEKMMKPDPRIYRLLLSRFGLAAGDCVFIDDAPYNVEGARSVGLHALHFTTPANLRTDLAVLGCLPREDRGGMATR